jgi:hypothetical protein
MNKIIITTLTLLSSLLSFSNEIFQFKLEKNEKVEATYTAEFQMDRTLHIAITKKSGNKSYFYTPFFVDENKKVLKCDSFTSLEKLQIMSYHLNNNVATIVSFDDDNKLVHVVDFNFDTGKNNKNSFKSEKCPENVFREANKTTLVFFDVKTGITVQEITSSDIRETKKIDIPAGNIKVFKEIVNAKPEAVNLNEYVKNGSIKKVKSYLIDDKYFMTFENKDKELEVFSFNLKTNSVDKNILVIPNPASPIRDFSNFVFDNKIGVMGRLKDDILISLFDSNTSKLINTLALSKFADKEKLDKFLAKSRYLNMKSTLTANKGVGGNFVLRLDNISESNYTYNYNWWMHQWFFQQQMFHQHMMMQHQIMSTRGFGPNPHSYESDMYFTTEKKKDPVFEITIDAKGDLVNGTPEETVFKEIDKEEYIEKYKGGLSKSNFSFGFIKEEMRYVYVDKKLKSIIISFEKL